MKRPQSRKLLVSRLVEVLASQPWPTYGPVRVVEDGEEYWEMGVSGLSDEVHVYGVTAEECRQEFPDMLRSWLMAYVDYGELPKGIGVKMGHVTHEARFDFDVTGPSARPMDTCYTAGAPIAVLP